MGNDKIDWNLKGRSIFKQFGVTMVVSPRLMKENLITATSNQLDILTLEILFQTIAVFYSMTGMLHSLQMPMQN